MSDTIKAPRKLRLSKEQLLQLVTAIIVLVALVALASNVAQRHLFAQNMLDEITPRYERLLGIQASANDMQGLTQRSNDLLKAYAYPSSREATQIGTDIQQKLRTAFAGQGMSIQSSQVLPEEEDGALMAVPVELRIEGNIQGLRNALATLSSQRPLIQLRAITIQKGRKLNVNSPVLLTIQAKFFAWRERP